MLIAGEPFRDMPFDFEGKVTNEQREEYLQDIRLVMETEYEAEIKEAGGQVEFYYSGKSRIDNIKVTLIELKAFDIKLENIRNHGKESN